MLFFTNFQALISSVEWLDFYNDTEGTLMSFISRSLLLLCNLSFMYAVQCLSRCIPEEIPVRYYMLGLVAVYYICVALVLLLMFFWSLCFDSHVTLDKLHKSNKLHEINDINTPSLSLQKSNHSTPGKRAQKFVKNSILYIVISRMKAFGIPQRILNIAK